MGDRSPSSSSSSSPSVANGDEAAGEAAGQVPTVLPADPPIAPVAGSEISAGERKPAAGFVCDCQYWVRSACSGEPFYKELDGKRYCVLHYPAAGKSAEFSEVLKKKLDVEDYDFRGAWFCDEVRFSFPFNQPAHFDHARFIAPVSFKSAEFVMEADFFGAHFDSGVIFIDATFRELAQFGHARFAANAVFTDARFISRAGFAEAVFSEFAGFSSAEFSSEADFSDAKFRSTASFERSTFNAATFRYARFDLAAHFNRVRFNDCANFASTTFRAAVNFGETLFKGDADFSYAVFHSSASFYDASFANSLSFSASDVQLTDEDLVRILGDNPTLSFGNARIEKPERVAFHTVILRPEWFVNVDPRRFTFTDVEWDWNSIKRREVSDLERVIGTSSWTRLLAIGCRQLAENAENNNRYEEASKFRYWAMDLVRHRKWKGWAFWKTDWLHLLYWVVSGYGERMLRAFAVLLLVWLVFAALYTKVGFTGSKPVSTQSASPAPETRPSTPEVQTDRSEGLSQQEHGAPLTFRTALTYSLAVMSLQKPEPRPLTQTAYTLVVLQTILGPVQAALLALAIRRKFMR